MHVCGLLNTHTLCSILAFAAILCFARSSSARCWISVTWRWELRQSWEVWSDSQDLRCVESFRMINAHLEICIDLVVWTLQTCKIFIFSSIKPISFHLLSRNRVEKTSSSAGTGGAAAGLKLICDPVRVTSFDPLAHWDRNQLLTGILDENNQTLMKSTTSAYFAGGLSIDSASKVCLWSMSSFLIIDGGAEHANVTSSQHVGYH